MLPCGMLQEPSVSLNGRTFADAWHEVPAAMLAGSRKLRSAHIGGSVTHIADSAFTGCTALREVSFGVRLTSIGRDAFAGDACLARCGARRLAVARRVRFVDAFAVLADFFVFASARYRTRIGIDALFVIAHLAIAAFGIADAFFDFVFIDAFAVLTDFRFICAWIGVVAFGFVDAFFILTNFCLICAWIGVVAFGLRFARLLCVTKPAFANDTRIAGSAVGNFIDADAIVAILIAIATWH